MSTTETTVIAALSTLENALERWVGFFAGVELYLATLDQVTDAPLDDPDDLGAAVRDALLASSSPENVRVAAASFLDATLAAGVHPEDAVGAWIAKRAAAMSSTYTAGPRGEREFFDRYGIAVRDGELRVSISSDDTKDVQIAVTNGDYSLGQRVPSPMLSTVIFELGT